MNYFPDLYIFGVPPFLGIRPELSVEDKRVKLKLAKCNPERYSKLLKPWELERQGFDPPPIPLSFIQPKDIEGSSTMKPTPEMLQAKVELLKKKNKGGTKRKAEGSFGGSLVTRAKVQKMGTSSAFASIQKAPPSPLHASLTSGLPFPQGTRPATEDAPGRDQSSPSASEVERALETARTFSGCVAFASTKETSQPLMTGKGVFSKSENSLITDVKHVVEAIASIIPESDIDATTFVPLETCVSTALYGCTSTAIQISSLLKRIQALEGSANASKAFEMKQEELSKTKEDLWSKIDDWIEESRKSLDALAFFRNMKKEYEVLAEANDAVREELGAAREALEGIAERTYLELNFDFLIPPEEEAEGSDEEEDDAFAPPIFKDVPIDSGGLIPLVGTSAQDASASLGISTPLAAEPASSLPTELATRALVESEVPASLPALGPHETSTVVVPERSSVELESPSSIPHVETSATALQGPSSTLPSKT
ncbi:unnamed protein product [Ilex paraguariensis]|uniref:Uncharacterized protein n=1 Tax=Ilex paraguariensis TaxID=185542 RepID=A0ABC8R384_9AQUA